MSSQGFEYERRDPSREFSLQVDAQLADPTYLLRKIDEIDSLGYALTEPLIADFRDLTDDAAVFGGEGAEYELALYGSTLAPGCIELAEREHGPWSVQSVADEFRNNYERELAALQSDPQFVAADERIVACMAQSDFLIASSLTVLDGLSSVNFQLLSVWSSSRDLSDPAVVTGLIEQSRQLDEEYSRTFKECYAQERTVLLEALDRHFGPGS